MLSDHWPLAALSVTTERLELRPPDMAELSNLVDLAARGVHLPGEQPYLTPWTDGDPSQVARHVLQQHWTRLGEWSPTAWALELALFASGQPIGMVVLKAREFRILREVRTESWLGLEHHRQGFGTEARIALLHLAFEHLGAISAVSEVFQDNAASQRVSRKLGYTEDGTSRDVLHNRVVLSDRLRLSAATWVANDHGPVAVHGLSPCLPAFGVQDEDGQTEDGSYPSGHP